MGNSFSRTKPNATPPQADGENGIPGDTPLFSKDVKAEPAEWSQEGVCTTLQRLVGMLPDSKSEALKQEQWFPLFRNRSVRPLSYGALQKEAATTIQRFYRRYRRLYSWHTISNEMLGSARQKIEVRRTLEEEKALLENFRQILGAGFAASNVSINGKMKNIQLQLVKNPDKDEYYLSWKPSKKRNPRIFMHEIEDVVPVGTNDHKYASRLTSKVSARRGLIIVTKSHHRGRLILEMDSKRSRNLMLHGFQRLLEQMNAVNPTMDGVGSLRKRLPRRQSVLDFFDSDLHQLNEDEMDGKDSRQASQVSANDVTPKVAEERDSVAEVGKTGSSKGIEKFYQTRFDGESVSEIKKPKKSFFRRSSVPNLRASG